MEKIIVAIVILFALWFINNSILKKKVLEEYQGLNEFSISILKYRKTIMFDIIVLIFFIIFNINFFIWIAIVYYIIIGILEGILIVIGLFTGLDADIKNKSIDKDFWAIFVAKVLSELSTAIMLFILFSILN